MNLQNAINVETNGKYERWLPEGETVESILNKLIDVFNRIHAQRKYYEKKICEFDKIKDKGFPTIQEMKDKGVPTIQELIVLSRIGKFENGKFRPK